MVAVLKNMSKLISVLMLLFLCQGCFHQADYIQHGNTYSRPKDVVATVIPDMPKADERIEQPKETHKTTKYEKKGTIVLETYTGSKTVSLTHDKEIDFEVSNKTGKTIFITCFAYLKKRAAIRWRWHKSPIYKLEPEQKVTVDIATVPDKMDRENVFGYLAVFNNFNEAEASTYELLPDELQVDLDQLIKLKGRTVVLEIEKYGARGEFIEYDFIKRDQAGKKKISSLDFPIENKTGKVLYVTCFSYLKKAKGRWVAAEGEKDDMSVWRFDKSPIIKLMPDDIQMMNIDLIAEKRDRSEVRGFLAVFNENEEEKAKDSVYELLDSHHKITLGRLEPLARSKQKLVLSVERYGVAGDVIDYVPKSTQKIDFTKIGHAKKELLKEKH